jgi:hypothetical protein
MDVVIVSIIFLAVLAIVVLRFTTILRQILDSLASDRRDRAAELDHAHVQAFSNALSAFESIYTRISTDQNEMLSKTVDMVAGPQASTTEPGPEPDPTLDARPFWQPDDAFDYSHLGLDPTDDTLPQVPLEPEGNEHRAIMIPPGESLI